MNWALDMAPGSINRTLLFACRSTAHISSIKKKFEDDDYKVMSAFSGAEALEAVALNQFSCVLLDDNLAGAGGLSFCRDLRNQPGGGQLPIILFAGQDDETSIDRAFSEGVSDLLVRPVNFALLRGRLSRLLKLEHLKQESVQALRTVDQAQWEKNQFLKNISAELKKRSQAVISFNSKMLNIDPQCVQSDLVCASLGEAESIHEYALAIKELIFLEESCLILKDSEFNFHEITNSAIHCIEKKQQNKGCSLNLDVQNDALPLVNGDSRRIRQLLVYLLQSAIHFSDSKIFSIAVYPEKDSARCTMLRFRIKCEEFIIKKELRDDIFNRHFDSSIAPGSRFSFAGLLLTLAKILTKRLGGQMGIRESGDGGTELWLVLQFKKQGLK